MQIREATKQDYTDALRLIKLFQEEVMNEFGFECDDIQTHRIMDECVGNALVLEVAEKVVGLIAGKIIQYPLDGAKMFHEMIWYVDKPYRMYGIGLLNELEKRCKSQGIFAIIMVAMTNSKSVKLDSYYRRVGFIPLETHYIKRL